MRCGEWDTQTEGEPLPHQDRTVQHVVLHPEFNKGNLVNTVALLFLESDFDLADHVDTICLPKYQENFDDRIQEIHPRRVNMSVLEHKVVTMIDLSDLTDFKT